MSEKPDAHMGPQTLVVCGSEICQSKRETQEERRAEYQRMAKLYGDLAKRCYMHPAKCRDAAARAYAYQVAAQHTP